MKSLRIYFGDLTHNTVGLATEVFPLNISYVAAYAKLVHGDSIEEVRLFKYIPDLERAILTDPPDILALSNYPWCHLVGLAMFDLLSSVKPDSIRVMGGPNFPHDQPTQIQFLKERPLIDCYIYLDGEVGFSNMLKLVVAASTLKEARELIQSSVIDGCVHLGTDEKLLNSKTGTRLKDLDEIPSPYLTGILDPFFDGQLAPMISTNRGCPFRCTFCHDGNAAVNKINQFSLERVKAELRYIAERVPNNTHSLFISDLNFGMYKRDLEISEEIFQIQQVKKYPLYIDTTTGKNAKERVIAAIERLSGSIRLAMSVQTMTGEVLRNIKRDNIKLKDFLDLQPAIRKSNLPTVTEVITALPGETLETHFNTLGDLLNANMDSVVPYTLMMIYGAEMNEPQEREKWGIKTKFRILPRDFTQLTSGRVILEVEEVGIATNTFSFEDYLEARRMALVIRAVNHPGFKALLRFLIENKFNIIDLLKPIIQALRNGRAESSPSLAPSSLVTIFNQFEKETVEELWDSQLELIAFFQSEENFGQLVRGEYGKNLLQSSEADIFAGAMNDLVECVFSHVKQLLAQRSLSKELYDVFEQVANHCRGRCYNVLGPDRMEIFREYEFHINIEAWLNDVDLKPIHTFRYDTPQKVQFIVTPQQFRLVENVWDTFGRTEAGLAKALTRINATKTLWREPRGYSKTSEQADAAEQKRAA